jgi:hypothetical protein
VFTKARPPFLLSPFFSYFPPPFILAPIFIVSFLFSFQSSFFILLLLIPSTLIFIVLFSYHYSPPWRTAIAQSV